MMNTRMAQPLFGFQRPPKQERIMGQVVESPKAFEITAHRGARTLSDVPLDGPENTGPSLLQGAKLTRPQLAVHPTIPMKTSI